MRGHWFWGAVHGNWGTYSQVLLAAAMINLFSLASSLFIMTVYDRVIPNEAVESLVALTIGMVIVLVFDFILKTLRGYYLDRASREIDLDSGARIFEQLMRLRLVDRGKSPSALSSIIIEFDNLKEVFTSATMVAIVDLPFIMLFIFVIWLVAGPIAIVPALVVPVVMIAGMILRPLIKRLSASSTASSRSKHATVIEAVSQLETVQSVGAEGLLQERWEADVIRHAKDSLANRMVSYLILNIASLGQQFAQVATVVYGVFLISDGELSFGGLIAAVILTGRTLAPLGNLASVVNRLSKAMQAYRGIDKLMSSNLSTTAGKGIDRDHIDGKIELRAVRFKYPGQTRWALDGISFAIEPGRHLGILGKNGSGKSSIVRLIAGLYDPDDGHVLIDDTENRQFERRSLRRNVGCMTQDSTLFSGALRENITLGDPDISDEDMLRAANVAGLHAFIGDTAAGYELMIGERGDGLSGGQKQAVMLARALVRPSPILLLDEPTSAMDLNHEAGVVERLEAELKGRTLILVTHRRSMLGLVDELLVLDNGKVAAFGPRDEVLKLLEGVEKET